jgi:hypothetical protein
MEKSVKITTTGTAGWQEKSRKWAHERECFQIRGVKAKHLAFCKELCDEFHYECHYDSTNEYSEAVFMPLYS